MYIVNKKRVKWEIYTFIKVDVMYVWNSSIRSILLFYNTIFYSFNNFLIFILIIFLKRYFLLNSFYPCLPSNFFILPIIFIRKYNMEKFVILL